MIVALQHDEGPPGGTGGVDTAEIADDLEGDERQLRCAQCGKVIARPALAITVGGQHEHTQLNPHGVFYRIGCWKEAGGCRCDGPPTTYWSWFPGYAWQVASCGRCGVHLGWRFSGVGAGFYGLITDRVMLDD